MTHPDRTSDDARHWTVDRRIQLPIIALILVQLGGGIWLASEFNTRLLVVERSIIDIKEEQENSRNAQRRQEVQSGRTEEQIIGLRADIARLITLMERQQGVTP